MPLPVPARSALALAAATLLSAGCGDDDPAGPEFGDLEFRPAAPVVIGAARSVDLELVNVSNGSLGPLVIGKGGIPLSFPREFTCPGLDITIDPSQVPSMGAGASTDISIGFSFAGLTEEDCPLATYEVDINAALGRTVLGSSQIRLDHTEVE